MVHFSKIFDNYGQAMRMGGLTALGGPVIGRGISVAPTVTKTSIGLLSGISAYQGVGNIYEGIRDDQYGKVSFGVAQTAMSGLGFRYATASSEANAVTVVEGSGLAVAAEITPQVANEISVLRRIGVNQRTEATVKLNQKINENIYVGDKYRDTANELQYAATSFAQQRQFWSSDPVQFDGHKVFQRNDLFDPKYFDIRTGKTNVELMQAGRAPIGMDGKSINLHHMLQSDRGSIVEVTQTFHQKNSSVIHINPNTIPSGIDRGKFNKWRSNYWKNRANNFK